MSDSEAPGFHVASEQEIREGKGTDVYFARTVEVLRREGVRKHVLAEVRASSLPSDRLRRLHIPAPPPPAQQSIVDSIRYLERTLNALGTEQPETQAELRVLMPAVLAKAYRGEL